MPPTPPSHEKIEALVLAQARDPLNPAPLYSLASALMDAGRYLEAADVCRRGLTLAPDHLGLAALDVGAATFLGDTEGMYRGYQRAARLCPGNLDILTHFAEVANRSATPTPQELFNIHADYGRLLEQQRPGSAAREPEIPAADRRLRIGIVSYDFRRHSSVPFFLWPALVYLSRDQFEIWIYQLGSIVDEGTERFRRQASEWRHLPGIDDDGLARQIRLDKIDIALEIHGHTGVRRVLPAFQPRCAPIQVSWVGYSNTTGVRSFDWRIVDSLTDPAPGADRLATERLWRLDPCFLCYSPSEDAPEPGPAPALRNGFVTFGAMSELLKINDQVLNLWARVVNRVPGSRLLLKNRGADHPDSARHLRARAAAAGLDPSRLDLLPKTATFADHLRCYHRMDIALDTFPYNGTTTVCESLVMGVPMVALRPESAHDRHSARVALSLLTGSGLPELIADNQEGFVRIAAKLGADIRALDALHSRVRGAFLNSPVCDGPDFGRRLGAAFREMWEARVASH
jgi:protein O-GlcNAc transferase